MQLEGIPCNIKKLLSCRICASQILTPEKLRIIGIRILELQRLNLLFFLLSLGFCTLCDVLRAHWQLLSVSVVNSIISNPHVYIGLLQNERY